MVSDADALKRTYGLHVREVLPMESTELLANGNGDTFVILPISCLGRESTKDEHRSAVRNWVFQNLNGLTYVDSIYDAGINAFHTLLKGDVKSIQAFINEEESAMKNSNKPKDMTLRVKSALADLESQLKDAPNATARSIMIIKIDMLKTLLED